LAQKILEEALDKDRVSVTYLNDYWFVHFNTALLCHLHVVDLAMWHKHKQMHIQFVFMSNIY